jgi:putative transposase
MLKRGLHTPAHLFIDNAAYFITGAIYQKRPLLAADRVKTQLLTTIRNCFAEKKWLLNDWVILDNHYHLLATSHKGGDMTGIFRKIHSLSAQFIQAEKPCELPIWWNYWDYCPRNEKDYFVRLNYLLNNPIKHGYVKNLHDYRYSSFHSMIEKQGRDSLANQFKRYTDYKKLGLNEDDF